MLRALISCLILLSVCSPALAQTMKIADGETVAIAFYKFAGLQPNFMTWAVDTPVYLAAPFARRPGVQKKEAERLYKNYEDFSRAEGLLNVATMASVKLEEIINTDNALDKTYHLTWEFAKGDATFFPYEYRGEMFALVPDEMESFQSAPITAEQYRYMKEKMGTRDTAKLVLQLRGYYADHRAPVHLRGEDFWALGVKLAGVSLWDRDGGLLWENTATWYLSPRTQSLNELHQRRQVD